MILILIILFLLGGIFGVVIFLGMVAIALLSPEKACPNCKALLPRFRKPAGIHEAMIGGWHCQNCGARVARNGALLHDDTRS
jgi:hypothetical protein